MIRFLKRLWFKLTYDEIALKCSRPLGKSLFIIIVLMSTICSAQTSILTYDVNGVTKLHARLNRASTVLPDANELVYPPNPIYIGIPEPPFGIHETYRMYDYDVNQADGLTYYDSPSGGKYTHYVDSTDPNATPNGVPSGYGSPDYPRKAPPINIPAGSIIEIHNDSLATSEGHILVGGEGTAEHPIFIRGVGNPDINLRLSVGYIANSSYIIVEGVRINRGTMSARRSTESFDTNHICYRNCEIAAYSDTYGGFAISGDTKSANQTHNVVLYNCSVHDNGDWDYVGDGDPDVGGIAITNNCSYIWILDCEMYYNGQSGIQIGGTTPEDVTNIPDHIYVGGCVSHHNRQVGYGIKTCYDVIFSQNIGFAPNPNATACYLAQYDWKRVWYLFNTAYSHTTGFRNSSGLSSIHGPREEIYYVGNLIYDCNNAISLIGQVEPTPQYIIMNTVYNCDWGVGAYWYNDHSLTSAAMKIYNNIFVNNNYGVISGTASYGLSSFDNNLVYNNNYYKWGSTDYESLEALITGTTQGDNCLEADPLFVNADANDFDLQSTSPVIGMSISPDAQTVYDRFEELYGITDLDYYCNQLFIQGVQNAPDAD